MDKIGVQKTAEAYLEGLPIFGKGPKALRDMAKKSAFMADRISNMERDIRRDPHIFDPTYAPLEFLRDNAYYGISFTDQLFSVPLWNKVYQEAFPKALAQINEENEAFQSTRSAGSATSGGELGGVPRTISIHALRRERDKSLSGRETLVGYFNPRAPQGARRKDNHVVTWTTPFQSTRSAGSATAKVDIKGLFCDASITIIRHICVFS